MKNTSNIYKYTLVSIISFFLGYYINEFLSYYDREYDNLILSEDDRNTNDTSIVHVIDFEMEKGFIYTGKIKNGFRSGRGSLITPKGTKYDGEWSSNKILYGAMITEKSEYEGQFKNFSPNGYGTMRYKDGSLYRGMWKDGNKSGIGLYVSSSDKAAFGLWSDGQIDPETKNVDYDKKVYGIDISHYNNIDNWGNIALFVNKEGLLCENKPKKNYYYQPINFVFVKATEGATHRDEMYLINMKNAKKYNKKKGSYHFMHFTSSSVKDQVENFLDYMVYEKTDLPPVLDVEVESEIQDVGSNEARRKVLKWLVLVEEKLGVAPIIYTSSKLKEDYFSTDDFKKYKFWIAKYGNKEPEYEKYLIWQISDKCQIYGINERLDVNVINNTYLRR